MPKKTATTRGGTQRNKPRVKVQKSFELVRQVSDEQEQEQEQEQEPEAVSSAEPTAVKRIRARVRGLLAMKSSRVRVRVVIPARSRHLREVLLHAWLLVVTVCKGLSSVLQLP